jgi:hypothetical protein
VQAQTVHYPPSSNSIGSGAYSKNFADVFSFTSNPAALGWFSSAGVGVFTEQKFLVNELTFFTMAAAIPISNDGIGMNARYYEAGAYKESHFGLCYGKSLGAVAIGTQFNYSGINIAGYGKEGVFHFDVGTLWQLSEKLITGLRISNPTGARFGNNKDDKLAFSCSFGLGYEVSKTVLINTEIIKEEDRSPTILLSLYYSLNNKFFLRAGIATATSSPWIGAGLSWKKMRVDITSNYHPQLGVSPGISFIFSGKQKAK